MISPKIKDGTFQQYEIKNGTLFSIGLGGNKYVNISTVLAQPDLNKTAVFPSHYHPGYEAMCVLRGHGYIPELETYLKPHEIVIIPKRKKQGIKHSVEFFEETHLWVVTWGPPDTDMNNHPHEMNLNIMDKLMTIPVIPFFI